MNCMDSCRRLDKVEEVEAKLDYYELTACIFLLYDVRDTALQEMHLLSSKKYSAVLDSTLIRRGSNYFQEEGALVRWAKYSMKRNKYWFEMLLEALLIIKNYQCITILGKSKTNLELDYLPKQQHVSCYIDLLKKALYLLLEKFRVDEWRILQSILSIKAKEQGIEVSSYCTSPESFLLLLMSNNVLKTKSKSQKMDFKILCSCLESMNHHKWAQDIKSIQDAINGHDDASERLTTPKPQHSHVKNEPAERPRSISIPRFSLDPEEPGTILIFNEENYDGVKRNNIELSNRIGSSVDVNKLKETFQLLKYNVIELLDKHAADICNQIRVHVKDFYMNCRAAGKERCFVVAILAHGEKDGVIGTDGELAPWDDIRKELRNSNLLGFPRLLLNQACKGVSKVIKSVGGLEVEEDGPGNQGDLFEFAACVPGFASYRSPKFGSFFINSFCKNLLLYGKKEDFQVLKLRVNTELTQLNNLLLNNRPVSIFPESTDTATKQLYLCPQNFNDEDALKLIQKLDMDCESLEVQTKEKQLKATDALSGKSGQRDKCRCECKKVSFKNIDDKIVEEIVAQLRQDKNEFK